MGVSKNKCKKIDLLTRSRLDRKAKIISEALVEFDISHEEFMPLINEKQNQFRLKETISKMQSAK